MLTCIFETNRNRTTSDSPLRWTISRSGKVIKIPMKGKVETVTVDRVKPAHFEREPGKRESHVIQHSVKRLQSQLRSLKH